MLHSSFSFCLSNSTGLLGCSAASSDSDGGFDPINHTIGYTILLECLHVCMCLCLWTTTYAVTFGKAQQVPQRGGGCINKLLMAISAAFSPGRSVEIRSALSFPLINTEGKGMRHGRRKNKTALGHE